MTDNKLREAAEILMNVMVSRRHSDLCEEGGDCVICDAITDIKDSLANTEK